MSIIVEIVRDGDPEEVVRRLGPYLSQRQADKAEDGVNINLNHNDYHTRQVPG